MCLVMSKAKHKDAKYKEDPKIVVYVGVHVRRGDMKEWLRERNKLPVSKRYYEKAMNYFRNKVI